MSIRIIIVLRNRFATAPGCDRAPYLNIPRDERHYVRVLILWAYGQKPAGVKEIIIVGFNGHRGVASPNRLFTVRKHESSTALTMHNIVTPCRQKCVILFFNAMNYDSESE